MKFAQVTMPIVFSHKNNVVVEALESGVFTKEWWKEISM